jgi:hypothetical protein
MLEHNNVCDKLAAAYPDGHPTLGPWTDETLFQVGCGCVWALLTSWTFVSSTCRPFAFNFCYPASRPFTTLFYGSFSFSFSFILFPFPEKTARLIVTAEIVKVHSIEWTPQMADDKSVALFMHELWDQVGLPWGPSPACNPAAGQLRCVPKLSNELNFSATEFDVRWVATHGVSDDFLSVFANLESSFLSFALRV